MPYQSHPLPSDVEAPARKLILAGGVSLSILAGYVNVVVLGVVSVPVSHMSGAVSPLGIDQATGNTQDLSLILMIIGGFLAGAVLSGAIIGGHQIEPGRRYGIALMAEAAALGGAAALLASGDRAGVPLAALALGIQNAMASSYYGLIIRTTHVTGIVTDLGVIIGQRLRGVSVEAWKPSLLVGLLLGFLIGGILGQLMLAARGPIVLFLAAAAAVAAGSSYFAWRAMKNRR